MKTIFKRFLIIVMIMLVAVSVAGCSLNIEDNGNKQEQLPSIDNPINNNTDYKVSFDYSNYSDKLLPDSKQASSSVSFAKNERPSEPLSIQEAYDKVNGSAVAIFTSHVVNGKEYNGAGSGVIIDTGKEEKNTFYILTCFHVIATKGAVVTVCLQDNNGRDKGDDGYNSADYAFTGKIGGLNLITQKIDKMQAVTLVGGDRDSDIAVLRLYVKDNEIAKNVKKAKIIDPQHEVKVAEQIFLLGNPTGMLSNTFTQGYLSHKNRKTLIGSSDGVLDLVLYQLDLGSWHGSSGGGVFNMYGELIAIVNSGDDTNIGINYGIPYVIDRNDAKDKGFINIAKQLIATATDSNYGYVSGRAMFGFTTSSLTNVENGVPYIYNVYRGSLEEASGLKANYVIKGIKINSNAVLNNVNYLEFNTIVKNLVVGDTLVLKLAQMSADFSGELVISKTTNDITLKCYQYHFCNTGK